VGGGRKSESGEEERKIIMGNKRVLALRFWRWLISSPASSNEYSKLELSGA
jgi:hypothetical protein